MISAYCDAAVHRSSEWVSHYASELPCWILADRIFSNVRLIPSSEEVSNATSATLAVCRSIYPTGRAVWFDCYLTTETHRWHRGWRLYLHRYQMGWNLRIQGSAPWRLHRSHCSLLQIDLQLWAWPWYDLLWQETPALSTVFLPSTYLLDSILGEIAYRSACSL